MKIEIEFTPQEYLAMQKKALSAGYNDVPEFMKAQYFTDYTTLVKQFLDQAMAKAKKLPAGTRFVVKELFEPEIWATIPTGVRRLLGKKFFQSHGGCGIKHLGPNAAQQTSYLKI
jgi:hypothetical protein